MLNGIHIYSADAIWRHILAGMGATVSDTPGPMNVNFDALDLPPRSTPMEIKCAVLAAMDGDDIVRRVVGKNVALPRLQAQIIIMLYKTGGMRGDEIKDALGYLPGVTTHAADTAIYQLRRTYGHDFIINVNGIYKLGKL